MSTTASPKPELTGRDYALASALAVTVAACMWVAQMDDESNVAQPSTGTARRAAPPLGASARPTLNSKSGAATQAAVAMDWAPVPRQSWAKAPSLVAWSPPAPPPSAPPPPPPPPAAPAAPQFPYQLIGMLNDGGAQALLAGPNRTLNVKVGDAIDGQWRVEKIDATSLTLTWLPGKLPQTIAFSPTP